MVLAPYSHLEINYDVEAFEKRLCWDFGRKREFRLERASSLSNGFVCFWLFSDEKEARIKSGR
jgi:hypothetical protein